MLKSEQKGGRVQNWLKPLVRTSTFLLKEWITSPPATVPPLGRLQPHWASLLAVWGADQGRSPGSSCALDLGTLFPRHPFNFYSKASSSNCMHSTHPPWASFTSLHRTYHQMTSYVHSTFVYHVPPTSMELHASRAHVESDTQVNSKCRCMNCVQEDIT